ncbi:hypothetical protein CAL29_00435 [Bordetella genomosp. 10]|uniref:Secretin/TonB short N-terminal domain-containing protein n=1 Tax=Bordetella genomosp. 10 TaxID=1416804 RepID=A0A261SIW6_9BORD|nr:TonB-dependent siderophore receptor [Bordetella genomosp. 10]OZI36947.1 hypothetical protein CAL29_00435 [Bordetella genomosp. 10]
MSIRKFAPLPVVAILATSPLSAAFAQQAARHHYDLPAGPLGATLNAIAVQGGRTLTLDPALVSGRNAPAIHGDYTVEQALDAALDGSGLQWAIAPHGALTVQAAAARGGAATLPTVRVAGNALNDGYQPILAASPKFTAPLLDTPKTVDVIPQAVIKDTASSSLQDVMRTMPGITFAAGEGGVPLADRPVIRGFNSTSNLLVDGMRDIGAQTRDVFDLEQIEVTKGPDSVYFGRGGGGGSINMVTKAPKLDNFAEGQFSLGTADYWRLAADGNWQLSDHSAFRLNVMGNGGHVAGRDSAVDFDKWGVAPSLAFGLGTPTRVTLNYYHLQDNGMPDYGVPIDPRTGSPYKDVSRRTFYGLKDRDFRHTQTDIGTIGLEHDINDRLTIKNMTRYGESTNSYVATAPNGASPVYADVNLPGTLQGSVFRMAKSQWTRTSTLANQTDLSGKFDTGPFKHSFDLGMELSHEKWTVDGWTVTSSNPHAAIQSGSSPQCQAYADLWASYDCTTLDDPNPGDAWQGTVKRNRNPTYYKTDTRAFYAFDTIELTEKWLVNAGVRWDHYDTQSSKNGDTIARQKDDFFNYQFGVVYKPAPNGSIYASIGTASTPAALGSSDYDKVSAANSALKPERSTSVEIGTKWNLFDEKLALTSALFNIDRKNANIQVDTGVYEQAGKSRVRGFELGLAGDVTPKWKVYGGYTYMDSEIKRGAYNDATVGQPLPDTPRNSFSLWSTYRVLPQWTVGGGAYYVGKRFGTACDRDCWAPSYWRFDALVGYQVNSHLDLKLNVQNVFDKVYYTKVHYFMGDLGPGRSAILTATVRY